MRRAVRRGPARWPAGRPREHVPALPATRRAVRAAPLAALLLLALAAGPAAAALAVDDADWDGLSRFALALRGADVDVRAPDPLPLDALSPEDGVALVGPTALAEPEALLRFVREGGRLLVADEGPATAPLLEALGVELVPAPAGGDALLGGHPALPLVDASAVPAFGGARRLVANHPAAFRSDGLRPAARFADGTAFGYHLRLGAGEVVLLADASLLINLMLDAGDNRQLAAGLGAWLSAEGARKVWILAGEATTTGRYRGLAPPEPPGGMAGALNRALHGLSAPRPDELAVRFFIALLLAATVVYALTVFPGTTGPAPAPPPPAARPAAEGRAGLPGGPAGPSPTEPPPA